MNDPTLPPDTDGSSTARRRIPWGRIGMVVAGSTVFIWLAAIVISLAGPVRDDDYLADRRFFTAAEPICKTARADVAALPNAALTPEPADRLNTIVASTDRLAEMVAALRAKVPDDPADQPVTVWLSHWEIHLSDRRDFIERVRENGTDERFLESQLAGAQVSKSINRFAEVNDIPSCTTPDDV